MENFPKDSPNREQLDDRFQYMSHLISERFNDKVIFILNAFPAMINAVNSTGQSLFHYSVKHNNVPIMGYLLSCNYDVDSNASEEFSRRISSANLQDSMPAEMLLDSTDDMFLTSANLKIIQTHFTQHEQSTRMFNESLVQLIEGGGGIKDLFAKLKNSNISLDSLVHVLKPNILKMLLCNQKSIEYVESKNSVQQCMYIIINDFNTSEAVDNFYQKNLELLLQFGRKVEHRREVFLEEFEVFINGLNKSKRSLKAIEYFIQLIIYLKLFDENAVNFVNDLYLQSSEEVLQVIVRSHLNSYIKSKLGYEPITYIFGNSKPNILGLIKREKIDVNTRNREGKSALHFAVESNLQNHVEYLLKMGVNPNVMNHYGATPIFSAFNNERDSPSNESCVSLLLEYGADVQVCDINGSTFVEYIDYVGDQHNFEAVLAHIALIESLEIPIENAIVEFINSSEDLNDYYKKMSLMLEQMKTHEVCRSLTLFAVLTNTDEFISHRIRSIKPNFIDTLRHSKNYKMEQYPLYYTEKIADRLIAAYTISKKRDKTADVICDCIQTLKPYYLVVQKISSFLTYEDMRNIEYSSI